jgi:hypothetical protein
MGPACGTGQLFVRKIFNETAPAKRGLSIVRTRASTPKVLRIAQEVGHTGLEPVTSCVSYKRASQLRQWPMYIAYEG